MGPKRQYLHSFSCAFCLLLCGWISLPTYCFFAELHFQLPWVIVYTGWFSLSTPQNDNHDSWKWIQQKSSKLKVKFRRNLLEKDCKYCLFGLILFLTVASEDLLWPKMFDWLTNFWFQIFGSNLIRHFGCLKTKGVWIVRKWVISY